MEIEHAQAWLNRRFSGLSPKDFDRTVIYSCEDLQPPPGFREIWGSPLLPGAAPEFPDGFESLGAVLVLASPSKESHVRSIRDFMAVMDFQGKEGPALYWVLHAAAPDGPRGDEPPLTAGLAESGAVCGLMELGMDGVIDEELEGLDLLLAVRLHAHKTEVVLKAFNTAIVAERQKKQRIKYYQECLDVTRWSYLRERLCMRVPPVDHTLEPGELRALHGYTFGRSLGSGFAGAVHLLEPNEGAARAAGDDTDGGRRQVVKMMSKGNFTQIEDLMRLKQLLDIMFLLNEERWRHRGLATLGEVYHSRTHVFLRMDCGGPHNLHYCIQEWHKPGATQPVDIAEIGSVVRQIVSVIAHLHLGPNICHRDIKPHNMIIDYTPEITLTLVDYDFAKVQKDGALCHNMCGTVPFIAPEVILQEAYDGMATDIWSAGMVFFQLLCGDRSLDKILTLPIRQSHNVAAASRRKTWCREHGVALKARFAQVDFMGRMAQMHCHARLAPLLPVMQPLLNGMCTVAVDRRFSSQDALDATASLGGDSPSGCSTSDRRAASASDPPAT